MQKLRRRYSRLAAQSEMKANQDRQKLEQVEAQLAASQTSVVNGVSGVSGVSRMTRLLMDQTITLSGTSLPGLIPSVDADPTGLNSDAIMGFSQTNAPASVARSQFHTFVDPIPKEGLMTSYSVSTAGTLAHTHTHARPHHGSHHTPKYVDDPALSMASSGIG